MPVDIVAGKTLGDGYGRTDPGARRSSCSTASYAIAPRRAVGSGSVDLRLTAVTVSYPSVFESARTNVTARLSPEPSVQWKGPSSAASWPTCAHVHGVISSLSFASSLMQASPRVVWNVIYSPFGP